VFDKNFFAAIICAGHGKIGGKKDGFLLTGYITRLNIFLIKVTKDCLFLKTVSAYRKYAFIQDFYHCQSDVAISADIEVFWVYD